MVLNQKYKTCIFKYCKYTLEFIYELSKTYTVIIDLSHNHLKITDDEVKLENNKPCTKFDFREIYKVNQ